MPAQNRRGPWLPEEDQLLLSLVNPEGPNNWVRIADSMCQRSPKQCRERFHQNLKPTLNHAPITAEEGVLIERYVRDMGRRWAEIARRLGNRSDNAVKNWWNGSMNRRKRLQDAAVTVPPSSTASSMTSGEHANDSSLSLASTVGTSVSSAMTGERTASLRREQSFASLSSFSHRRQVSWNESPSPPPSFQQPYSLHRPRSTVNFNAYRVDSDPARYHYSSNMGPNCSGSCCPSSTASCISTSYYPTASTTGDTSSDSSSYKSYQSLPPSRPSSYYMPATHHCSPTPAANGFYQCGSHAPHYSEGHDYTISHANDSSRSVSSGKDSRMHLDAVLN